MGRGDNEEEANQNHDENLVRLLEQARKAILRLNSSKMNLRKSEVRFMGHLITKDGLKPDPEKVRTVQEMPKPTSKKELLSLLGFVNYLSKFLQRLPEVTQPLRETAKEAKFIWSPQHETAFQEVRELVVRHPVLKYYDLKEEVTVQCDSSEYGLGAALLQNGQPVAFASRSLSQTERQYAQIEKECLAIVFFKPGAQMYVADHLSRASLQRLRSKADVTSNTDAPTFSVKSSTPRSMYAVYREVRVEKAKGQVLP